jgi:predicted ATPase
MGATPKPNETGRGSHGGGPATTVVVSDGPPPAKDGGNGGLFITGSLKQNGGAGTGRRRDSSAGGHLTDQSSSSFSSSYSSSSMHLSPASSSRRRLSALSLSLVAPSFGAGGGGPGGGGTAATVASSSSLASSASSSAKDLEVLRPSSERLKQERINSVVTANQLRFDRLRGLCGRDYEVGTLRDCLGRMAAATTTTTDRPGEEGKGPGIAGRREVVWISGPSGAGKSALAQEMKRPVERMNGGGVFCSGKYGLNLRDQPFVGITQVCNELCQKVALRDKQQQQQQQQQQQCRRQEGPPDNNDVTSTSARKEYVSIRERLEREMGEENIEVLSTVVDQIQLLVRGSADIDTSPVPTQMAAASAAAVAAAEGGAPHPDSSGRRRSFRDSGGADKKRDRLAAAFRAFFAAVCSHMGDAPVVLVLDDLQWADSSSLDVITTLATDRSNSYSLMIIGCYRSDEVDDDHPLHKAIDSLRDRVDEAADTPNTASSGFMVSESLTTITDIQVGALSVEHVGEMLSDLLSKDLAEVRELAELCWQRTQGNVFFLRAFLTMLVQEGFLKFHIGTFQWDWNLAEIENETAVTANLVDLIQARMMRMEGGAVELVKLAACLGHTFDREILRLVWTHVKQPDRPGRHEGPANDDDDDYYDDDYFDTCLQSAVQQACLVAAPVVEASDTDPSSSQRRTSMSRSSLAVTEASSTLFRFSHDQVQESACRLIPEEDFAALQYDVGMVLLKHLQPDELESMLFVVANLVNCRFSGDVSVANARLNLRAASRAKDLAAFSSVVSFVTAGIRHLASLSSSSSGADMWTQPYSDLALELHSLGASAEQLLGNNNEATRYCSVILAQRGATTLQKCVAYKVKLDMLHCTPGKSSEALDLCLEYLGELGCKFPKQKLLRKAMVGSYVKETRSKYIPTLSELRHLPLVSDPVVLEVVQLLERAANLAYLCLDRDLYVLVRCRFVRMVREHGLSEMAGAAFASFANVLMHEYGMYDVAIQLAEASLEIQALLPSQFYRGRTLVTANFYVFGWTKPLHGRLKYFIEGYEQGIRAGNTNTVSTGLMFYLNAEMAAGSSLRLLQQDLQIYVPQLRLLNGMHSDAILPLWQLCDNLQGRSGNTTLLTGEVWDEEAAMALKRPYFDAMFPRWKAWACCHFGGYEAGAKLVLDVGGVDALRNFPGVGFGMECLPFGVCCYAASRVRGSPHSGKYRKLAERVRAEARSLAGKGCVNLVHVVSLLDAEHHALRGRGDKATECYGRAATEAARGGFLSSAAIANKRFSDHLSGVGDAEGARYRRHEAVRYYHDWGATRVADLLSDL